MLEYPKRICWWHGTDALKLVMFPPFRLRMQLSIPFYRLFWRLVWRFFHKHYVHDKYKKRALVEFGIPEDRIEVKHTGRTLMQCPKARHNGFNVLFYLPSSSKYRDWMYGRDYYNALEEKLDVNWIIADGTVNMANVYPVTDAYIKINRTVYNGLGRMAEECESNHIPIIEVHAYRGCFSDHIQDIVNKINLLKQQVANIKE